MTDSPDRALTRREAAALWGCSLRTFDRHVQAGRVPYVCISLSGVKRFRYRDVLEAQDRLTEEVRERQRGRCQSPAVASRMPSVSLEEYVARYKAMHAR